MSIVEEFPAAARRLTEFEALTAAAPSVLDAIPGAVYICDKDGWLVRYNSEAAELWGQSPSVDGHRHRFCGSHALFLPDGTPLAHDVCPMAKAVLAGASTRNAEVVIERPDGSRLTALVNIRPLKDHDGRIQGAINCFQDISAHKELEETIQQKNADLEDFFENSAIGLHIVGGDGIIQRANKAELALLGYTAEEYVGRHIVEFHVDAPVIGDILHKLSCGEKLDRYPARLRAKDGTIKQVLITSNSRFQDGKFISTRCFTTDVTDLREAEAARRDSDERLAATYDAATIGIAEADREGRLLRVNDTLCLMLGRSREKLLNMTFFDFTQEDDREEDAVLYARQIAGQIDDYALRKRAARPDGSTVYLDVHSSSVLDADGNFRYGVRVLQDVTVAKQMEDQIRESEQHLRDLLEALPAAVYTTDAAGRITFFNQAAVEMSGRTPELGDMWCVTWRLYNPDGSPLPHDQCPMAVALKEDRPIRGTEAIAERPDGSRIPFIPYPTPLHDGDGKPIGAINMLVDITERKQAENRQKVLIDELNHRVKNTLATVQSLASQTARHADGLEDFSQRFEARLLALSRAHDLLTTRHWEGASLDALVHEVLTAMTSGAEQQILMNGPAVDLDARTALSVTIALNELATNAIKYGALSSEAGRLSVTWRLEEDPDLRPRLLLEWRERDGPPVLPPTRRGIGSRLIERAIERDLGGQLDLVFEPQGVVCRMSFAVGPGTA
ncbi:MAG TPA: PAS domain S-box protein [Pseudorhizobium sp.]|jgi:PAS domain S-box-containing protein|nr:PAS domain S-box protein [Pseudorhizobium sp.]